MLEIYVRPGCARSVAGVTLFARRNVRTGFSRRGGAVVATAAGTQCAAMIKTNGFPIDSRGMTGVALSIRRQVSSSLPCSR